MKRLEELMEKDQLFKMKPEGELTSGDDQITSEDQEEQEKEEKKFMEEQRTSNKNSRASSQKKSGQSGSNGSHKDSAGSGEEVIKLNKKVQEA